MNKQEFEADFDEIFVRFNLDESSLPKNYFKKFAETIKHAAKHKYSSFRAPRVMSLSIYSRHLFRLKLIEDLSIKTIKRIDSKNPPSVYMNRVELLKLFPPQLTNEIHRLFYNEPISKRKKIWDRYSLPLDRINNLYKGMLNELDLEAQKDGLGSRIGFSKNYYKIPDRDYKQFTSKYKDLVDYCNINLPKHDNLPNNFYSWSNKPCFFCIHEDFPLKDLKQTRQFMERSYPLLYRYKAKIKVTTEKNTLSKASYLVENDSILITINNVQNMRHMCLDLIHELSHAVIMLKDFTKGVLMSDNGEYLNEKRAIEREMAILKSMSVNLYKACFSDFLLQFRQTLFEIEMFTNPVKNPGRLYAEIFNKCFRPAKQKFNPLYILEESIIHHPLSTLHYAVAEASIVSKLIKSESRINN